MHEEIQLRKSGCYGDSMTQTLKFIWSKIQLPIFVILALTVAACGSTGKEEKKEVEALKVSVEAFNDAFKWEDFLAAYSFVPPGKKEEFWAEVDKFKGKVRVVEYQVRDIQHDVKSPSATAILHFQFWRTDAPTIQTVSFKQHWYYFEKEKRWKVLDSGFGVMTRARAPL